MAEKLTRRRLLGFHDFFPNEIPKSKEFYAEKIGKDLLIKSICYFLNFFRQEGTPHNENLFKFFFTHVGFDYEKSPSYWQILEGYKRICRHNKGEQYGIISVESLLDMYLWIQDKKEVPAAGRNKDASSALFLFEIILIFNDIILGKYNKASKSTSNFKDNRQLQRLTLAGSFSQSDLVNVDYAQLLFTQIFKLCKLLEFLELHNKYEDVLKKLLFEFGMTNIKEYIKVITPVFITTFKAQNASWNVLCLIDIDEKEKIAYILDKLSIQDDDLKSIDQDDYLQIRNKPFQKISKYEYLVIFDLFLIKKAYNGLIFLLSSYDRDFLGKIRNDFSEGVLVYETLSSILKESGSMSIPGKNFIKKMEGEPDYYYRSNTDIWLFESKDFFIRAKYKQSYDFEVIETELKKDGRFLKGIKQIIKNINRCLMNEIVLDNIAGLDNLKFYPILIVHDSLYSAPALNYWLHYWFVDELAIEQKKGNLKNIESHTIMPLTVLEIDTLIFYENIFRENKVNLKLLVEEFHKYVNYQAVGINSHADLLHYANTSVLSFSEYVRSYCLIRGYSFDFEKMRDLLTKYIEK